MLEIRERNTVDIAKRMFHQLHEVPEIDSFLDKAREYFRIKYNIDYFSVHMLHHKRSNLISNYNHDKWHEWLYANDHGANHKDDLFIQKLPNIEKNEIYFDYFGNYTKDYEANMRADIIGIRKYGGFQFVSSDNLNNISVFDVTFKDDGFVGNLDQKILCALRDDLLRYKPLLLPFINHADQFGDFSDKHILHKSINKFQDDHLSLFNF